MRVTWHGQSTFTLSAAAGTIAIDPFAKLDGLKERGLQFDYPPLHEIAAELVLVTHEHADHNGVEAIAGEPPVLRSTAGTLDSPYGQVTAVASEHDEQAGTMRGPNTIFVFTFDELRTCHLGDFGQRALREEQQAAIGAVELLFVPVGGGPTIGADGAAELVARLQPRWVVPMHYRTARINFLETADEFLARFDHVHQLDGPTFETGELPDGEHPLIVVPAVP
jgi:L-ascorbate metabolism protein UlaG (beta-lactamase superfamily)